LAERTLEYVALDDLTPNPINPKLHDIDGIADLMDHVGYIDPVVLDERTGQLISGHGRLETLQAGQRAGTAAPEGIRVADDGTWLLPVVRGWASKDDDDAAAALIGLNRFVERGGWDQQNLALLLASMDSDKLPMSGYGADDLADLLAAIAGPPSLDDLGDSLDEPSDEEFWPVLRFKVPPTLRGRYLALVAEVGGGDAEQFGWLVSRAERK
jgi:hypothetical protein